MEAWMASMPDVHARVQADRPARVADRGCGAGWSTIGLARAFSKAEVTGFDIDGASIRCCSERHPRRRRRSRDLRRARRG
jgi:trans-aconitate methyltransferase